MPERAKELFFVGELHPVTGEPMAWFNGIPARDLSKEEVSDLTDEQYKMATNSELYQVTKPAKSSEPAKPAQEG